MTKDSAAQRIAKLTPLAAVFESFQTGFEPVAPAERALADAVGLTLAADVALAAAHPAQALALRDGFAVRADATQDASAYAPVAIAPAPPRIDLGAAMPAGTDAVAPPETVTAQGEISVPLAPGDGVLAAGADAPAGVLRLAGARLRRVDAAAMRGLGIERVLVRQPRVRVVRTADGAFVRAAAELVAGAIASEGGNAIPDPGPLERTLGAADTDAVVAVGGTGSGGNDASVATLARHGRVELHGIGISPGETAAFGFCGDNRPVLLLPGRLDGAIAAWLTVGRRMLARLCFRLVEEQPFLAELSRKAASPLGLAGVVPVRRRFSQVEPLGSGHIPAHMLARADGWILIPADSEGYPAGTKVPVRPWP